MSFDFIFVFNQVNGINLRKASYDHAASVLRSCGSSIDMLVQYNPEEGKQLVDSLVNVIICIWL